MEVAGEGVGPFHLGPLTSTPIESSTPSLPTRSDSLSSESSEGSGEDWLIKVCCPGARHRYSKRARGKKSVSSRSTRTGISSIPDTDDDFTEKTEWMPIVPCQDYSKVPRQDSTDLQWLIRLRCPRAQMEQLMPDLKQGGAFLESYSPSSYDPFFLKTCSDFWKASVPPLHDPLLKEVQGRYIEAGIIQQCDTGKLYSSKEINELHKTELPRLPLSRQLVNPIEWLKIPFQYMESDVRQRSRRKMSTTRNVSSMDFKSWGDSAWPPLKKRCPSVRRSEFTQMPSVLSKQIFTGSSVWKPTIKSASY